MLEKSLTLLTVQVEDDVPNTEHVTPLHMSGMDSVSDRWIKLSSINVVIIIGK
jgi:hypothetical protein